MDLSNYSRIAAYDLPEPTRTTAPTGNLLAQEASGVAYNWTTQTLFIVGDGGTSVTQVGLNGQLIDTMTLAAGSSPQGTEFYDTEGIAYVGGTTFVFTEERLQRVVEFDYASGTTLTRDLTHTVALGADVGNIGLEGVAYDRVSHDFILVKEKDPEAIFQTTIDFDAGTSSNGSASLAPTNLFDPAQVGTTDLSDVYVMANNPLFAGTAQESHLLVLSQETGRIVEIGRDGTVYGHLDLVAPTTSTGIDLAAMTVEGITMDDQGRIYLVSEEGGGDFNHPQLWVYAPPAGPNQAPTGVSLSNPTASILENADTTARIKVADVAIADDGQGTNTLTLSGADAAHFEVDATGLYLKAGTTLDYETKATYDVTVNVDDASLGATPDASVAHTFHVTNIVNEAAAGSVAITEVAPWGSSAPAGADWFELTNTGSTAIDLTNWKMDDSSNAIGSAVALQGVTSIAPGESVIFLEGDPTKVDAFKAAWFGANPPAGLQVGYYSGSGVGLSGGGDAVNVFDGAGTVKASVAFGASAGSAPFATFDNAAEADGTITGFSSAGVNGAFAAANDAGETGSPGTLGGVPAPVNQAPTAIGLSGEITSWSDATSTATRVKVASVVVTDDGLGANNLTLSGADASSFEVDATGLYIKAGTTLDATVKSHYDVTVNVDDPTVGSTPDDSVDFSLDLTHAIANPLRITEVAPWSSGDSPVGADWFEVTNVGGGAVDITGWKMDDNSNAAGNAVALNGVTSIAPGESAIFIETNDPATVQAFIDTWFGGAAPPGLQIGTYSGSGVGLGTGGDAVNLYDSSGQLQANVTFGASPSGPFATFDNSAGTDNAAITAQSAAGVHGAFAAAGDGAEIGSPGLTAASANQAPTAVTLTNVVGQIHENLGTATHIKVADVAVTDDGLGGNALSLSGADAASFEVDATGLYLKAGVTLDYEAKASYDVTVNVDDATVGASTPDASTRYSLHVVDVADESAGTPVMRITEVAPWSSGNSPVAADWFEVTNTGSGTADISGWKMDDSSFSAASAVKLNGVVSVGAGESVIFVEGDARTAQTFIDTWFGGHPPAGLQVGYYSGGSVSLSTGGDGVALYDSAGALQAKVLFGSSAASAPFATFDNSAGADNVTLSSLSAVGVHGGITAAGDSSEIGSPGAIATNQPPPPPPVTGGGGGVITGGDSGTTGSDVVQLGGAPDHFAAGGGGDTVSSGVGDDWVNGNAGADSISGGSGADTILGGRDPDLVRGDDGPDQLYGDTGDDTVYGGLGDDHIEGGEGSNFLRGDEGNDGVVGGVGFDNVNGNAGDDTVRGGDGADWVLGGKDQDQVSGDAGADIVNGNMGADTCSGGDGADTVRGGQADDLVDGGAGNDWLSGDLGNDTLTGGGGADVFNFFRGAGEDRVTDFNFAEGDRVHLLPGQTFTASQVGADTVVDLSGGDRLVLANVQLSTLSDGWVVAA